MQRFAKIVMGKNSINFYGFPIISGGRGYLISSNLPDIACKFWLKLKSVKFIFSTFVLTSVQTFPSKSDKILILAPNCLYLDYIYKIFKYQSQIRIQRLQTD